MLTLVYSWIFAFTSSSRICNSQNNAMLYLTCTLLIKGTQTTLSLLLYVVLVKCYKHQLLSKTNNFFSFFLMYEATTQLSSILPPVKKSCTERIQFFTVAGSNLWLPLMLLPLCPANLSYTTIMTERCACVEPPNTEENVRAFKMKQNW